MFTFSSAESWCGNGPRGAGRESVPSAGEVTLHIRGVVSFREEQGAPAGGHKGPSHLRVPDFHGPSP